MSIELKDIPVLEMRLLSLIQAGFPLSERPFALLAQKLGTTEDNVIQHMHSLKENGLVREIGPVINPQALGYRTTLVAMKTSTEDLDKAQEHIWSNPGISHAYLRENEFNLWVTLAMPAALDMESAVADLGKACQAHSAISLPAVKTYKLKALFGDIEEQGVPHGSDVTDRLELEDIERRVVNAIQQDLPLVPSPFDSIAKDAGTGSVTRLIAVMESLQMRGVIRRYGANINHRQAGYAANAIICWHVPENQADLMGRKLASLLNVSHCYLRKAHPLWPYNMYAMLHASNREDCLSTAASISEEQGVAAFVPLFSTYEIKKQRNRYSV